MWETASCQHWTHKLSPDTHAPDNTLLGMSVVLIIHNECTHKIVHTDASGEGLGTVLYPVFEGKKRIIAYASGSLSRSEKNYPVHKLEFLPLNWVL